MEKLDHQEKAVPAGCQAIIDLIEMGDRSTDVANIINERNVDINWVHRETGLPLLHYAVGSDRLETVRVFLAWGVKIGPDAHGRWPSILALQCECSDGICDLIEREEALLETQAAKSQTATSHLAAQSAPAAKPLPSDKAKPGVYSYFQGRIIEEEPVNPPLVDLEPEVLRRGGNRANNKPSIPGPIKRR